MRDEEIIEYPADQTTLTKRYTEEAVRFIEAAKEDPFFLYLPHTMVHLPLAVSKKFAGRTDRLIWDAIEEVDWSVGQITEAVHRAGLDTKTLIIFTSDNGAAVGSSLPLRSRKGSVYDGGIREPTVMQWKGKIPPGSICREVAASVDLLPTLAFIARAKLPAHPIDGHNIWPLMEGKQNVKSPHDTYCLLHGPGTVRSGKWKYYPWQEGTRHEDRPRKLKHLSEHPVQLYDTLADIGETTNLAEQYPKVVERLQAAFENHQADLNANQRPAANLQRPEGSLSPSRPR